MKVVYGNPKTVLTLGVSLLGDIPTPFIGFVDRAKVSDFDAISRGTDASAIISRIDDAGGVIIYIENPDAAERLHSFMSDLFCSASQGDWGGLNQSEAGLQ